ncbi:uncharacterized protein LOC110682597 [Chenopodium quinoa]|uniref:uncharacterized protein LOC110682597 n=1 Tax=Chenopodium quinoa TaxID=63459 RepID=UPI000B79A3C5|nr:uncharacterized protein LOC110682597 [Chenopodium quinoa]
MKLNGVTDDAIRQRLFPFSLRDRAKEWLRDEGTGLFDTWDKLVKAFLVKFLGNEKTTRLRNELQTFRQSDDESLYEAWRRFKRLQRQCPHHGIPDWILMQTFYNGMTHEFRIYIDVASGGSLLKKNPTEARELIEKMAANDNYHPGGRNTVKKGGKLDVDALTMLTSSVQALTSKFDKFQAGTSNTPQELCQLCHVQGHVAPDCPQISQNAEEMSIDQANAFYSSNPKRPYDPYSNTYNEGWKHHPNFSYKNSQAQQNPPPPPQPNTYNQPPPGFQHKPPNAQQPMQPQPQKSSLEVTLESFITATNSAIQHQNSSIQQLQAQNKLMENQIIQLANQFNQALKTPGTFPGQTEQPQRAQMNFVALRSGRQLDDPPTMEPSREVNEEAEASEKEVEDARVEEASKETPLKPLAPYVPKIPFPQRLAQAKLEKKFSKFLDILKKLHINIPFLDAISEIPSYENFLKTMLSNKRKIEENTTVALNAECSAILQNTFSKKLGDPGSYSIPVKLGDIEINRALCDLGASVSLMPLSICKKLQLGELKPTQISLQLADRSVKFPLGVLEDVPLRVGKFFIPCDFVVMKMEEDVNVPIILGRPFLATAGAIIDMKKGKITFEVGDEKLEYSLLNVMGAPSTGDTIYQISQLSQQVNRLSTLQDQAKVQKEQCNAIFLRRDELFPKQIVEKVCIKEPRKDVKSKDVQGSKYVAPPANDEPMPFSQRLSKAVLDGHNSTFDGGTCLRIDATNPPFDRYVFDRNFVKGKDKVPPDGMFGYMKVNSIIRQVNKPMKESLGGIHEPHRGPPPPCNDLG